MANESHKQEFRVRDLSTRSVLLFPTQAQVIRDITGIALQPGVNKIVIDGITPTADENSIKVEGTGSATITEVSVDLLPNREIYEEIYPSDNEAESDTSDDESEAEIDEMKELNKKIKNLQTSLLSAREKINSGTNRLQICDNFGQSVQTTRPPPADLKELLQAYRVEREEIYKEHEANTAAVEDFQEQINKIEKEKAKLAKSIVKANEKRDKEKAKLQQQKLRKKAEAAKEKARVRAERESFWAKKVYKVTISIETNSELTPASSRRGSVDGDTIVNLATSDFHEGSKTRLQEGEISLSLSYITYSASWSPRYDLALNTIKNTGALDYGAELRNTTSEIWKDCKVILSTSQTTFSGLSETIPVLQPWHVRLVRGKNVQGGLYSTRELSSKRAEYSKQIGATSQKPRHENFGWEGSAPGAKSSKATRNRNVQQVLNQYNTNSAFSNFASNSSALPPPQLQEMALMQGYAPHQARGGLFGGAPQAAAAFGVPSQQSGLFGAAPAGLKRAAPSGFHADESVEEDDDEDMGFGLFGEPANKPLVFEEGAWEESGMTTTYDVPGFKTLAPSNSTIKHKIAKVEFRNVVFSHIIIGKLRQVAFLKARLRNTSKISLLKGPLGLTLDGSFLGQATFPRVSSGESFSLPLGVDPAINVAYPKPTVQRSQSGIFSKEDSNIFTRSVIITNTKHTGPVELTVLDQVPVSEDDRLKIDIVNPRGLKIGGDGVKTGQSLNNTQAVSTTGSVRTSSHGVDGSAGAGKWGSAVATTKKGGEVSWHVKLNPGQGVKLLLEYETSFPSGENVVGVDE